jgi:hypothetical protein
MGLNRLRNRLVAVNAVLEEIDRRRVKTANPDVGWAIEKRVLDAEILDLERAITAQENTEHSAAPKIDSKPSES